MRTAPQVSPAAEVRCTIAWPLDIRFPRPELATARTHSWHSTPVKFFPTHARHQKLAPEVSNCTSVGVRLTHQAGLASRSRWDLHPTPTPRTPPRTDCYA